MSLLPSDGTFGSAQRQRIFRIVILAISVIYIGRLAWLQIIQGNVYKLKAEAQAIKQISTEPFRGMVYDRNGRAIVQNAPGFSITVTPYEFTDSACSRLSRILGTDVATIWADVRKSAAYNKFAPAKISSGRDVDFEVIAAIEEQRDSLPGVDLIVDPKRLYAFDGNASHILGYVREVSERELATLGDAYAPGDITGKAGIEMSYEANVRGQKGLQFVAVNKNGQRVASFNDGKSDLPGLEGDDLYLGIDTDVQELAEKLLGNARGAVVAIDPRNGEIIALASKPDFNIRNFTGKTSQKYFNQVFRDPEQPFFSRVTQPLYAPGSTWKPVMALMGLQEGVITPTTRLVCAGGYRYGNRFALCHGGVHGLIDVSYALKVSCNSFFYQVGLKMGVEKFHYYAALFGFGQKTRIDLTEEGPGILPSRAFMDRRWGKGNWTDYALMNWGIGQGEVQVTPLQLCAYTAAIANDGVWCQPHAVREIYSKKLKKKYSTSYESRKIPIEQKWFDLVQDALSGVIEEGTGRSLKSLNLSICGKTGTAQASRGKPDQSWFMCFAPKDNPRIALVVTGEGKGFGASFAVPIAGKLLDLFFNRTWPADVPRDSTWLKQPGSTPTKIAEQDTLPQQRGPFARPYKERPVAPVPRPTVPVASAAVHR
ncbi:MAG: penicillin-binding protein 2 [Ignavibacteria bacterium]|nr:penicillin-binding protein 2 [Ignavibacteria bacterium]MBK7577861.1 penicillin-binding protein 2 [Ignavibacteria bacterium]MBL0323301.1 penicillin-binding protein 2 [Ignavibacteria bacterium]